MASFENNWNNVVTFSAANYEWILDLEASDHMTCQKMFSSNERKLLFDSSKNIPDGSSVSANSYMEIWLLILQWP